MASPATERRAPSRWRRELRRLRRGCALEDPYRREQGALIRRRVRPLAWLVALLAVAWIPLDAIALHPHEFQLIALSRVLLAATLCTLALQCRRLAPLPALAALITLQCLGFAAMQASLAPGEGGMLRMGYSLFPFVVAAELAIFPLLWSCALRLALPIALLVATPLVVGKASGGMMLWNTLWLLALLLALSAWASHAQLSLMRELLLAQRDASHDPLTGLLNRRAAGERFAQERERAMRQHAMLSVLMLDIDHFKRINDRWGHAAGDGVLLALADVLRQELRANDIGVRHGGEEFLVILPAASPAQAFEAAERMRAAIAELAIPVGDGIESITVSVGIATFDGIEGTDELIARADAALYQAKQGGRNRSIASGTALAAATPALDPNHCNAGPPGG